MQISAGRAAGLAHCAAVLAHSLGFPVVSSGWQRRRGGILGVLLPAIAALAAVLGLALQAGDGQAAPGGTPSLGVVVAYLTPESSPVFGVEDGRGALVVGVAAGSSAAAAGVAAGDVIRALAGAAVSDPSSVVALVQRLRVGTRTQIVVRRGGVDRSLALVIGDDTGFDPAQAMQQFNERYAEAVAAFEANDSARAVAIAAELAQRGHAPAQNLLGVMTTLGVTGDDDPAVASWWYRLAAHQGESSAQNNLAWQYWDGAGVPRDNARAYFWMSLAAAGGEQGAMRALDQIAAVLQPAEQAAAEAWLAWIPAPPEPVLPEPVPPAVAAPSAPAIDAAPPAPAGPSRDEVRQAQQELARLGYDAGVADGIAGRRTRSAVRDFQEDAGLTVDGEITPALLAALAAAPTPAQAAAAPPTQPAAAEPAAPDDQGLGELGFPPGDLEIQD